MAILEKLEIERLFDILEKDRFTITTAFIYLIILGLMRSLSESFFFDYPTFSIYLVIQHTAFNFPVLFMGVIVLKMATGKSLRNIFNLILLGFWVVALPPFIDHYIFGYSGIEYSYLYSYYGENFNFIDKIASIYPPEILLDDRVSPGLRTMLFSLTAMSSVYVAFKVKLHKIGKLLKNNMYRPVVERLSSVFFGGFGIWIVMWFINASVPTIISLEKEGVELLDNFIFRIYNKYYAFLINHNYTPKQVFPSAFGNVNEIGLGQGLAMQQRSLFITMYFVILSSIFLYLTLRIFEKKVFSKIISKMNYSIICLTIFCSFFGISLVHMIDPDFSKGLALDPKYILHIPYIFYIGFIGLFLGLFGSFVISFYENEKDTYLEKQLIMGSILSAISFGIILGGIRILIFISISIFLIWLAFKGNGRTYGLKESLFFSISNLSIALLAFYSPSTWKITIYKIVDGLPAKETYQTINITRNPEITFEIIGILIVMTIMIFIGNYILKFIREGRINYPKTFLFFPIFLLPLIWFNSIDYLLMFPIFGIIASSLTNEKNTSLILYFLSIELLYVFLRLTGIASFSFLSFL